MSFKVKYVYDLRDQMSARLNQIDKSLKKTTAQIKKTASSAALSFKEMKRGLDKMGRSARDLGKSLFLKATLPITVLGGAMIKAASDAEETNSKFATVFKDVGKEADQMAKTLAKNFGLSRVKAKELLGDTGDLLTGFGFTGKAALDLSSEVNKLAVDLASFTNFSGGAEGASKALTKALLGERESIKSLGISILESDVKARVIQLVTVDKMTFASLRQAKAFATLQIAQEQSKNAIGDFARTSEGFANQARILKATLNDVSVSFGVIMLPIALKVLLAFKRLAEKFEGFSTRTKKIILVVAGLVAVLAPLLIVIGFIASGVAALIPVIGFLIGAFVALKAVMFAIAATNPIFLMAILLTAAVVALRNLFLKFKDDLFAIWDAIKQKIVGTIKAILNPIDTIRNKFKSLKTSLPKSNELNANLNSNINNTNTSEFSGKLDVNFGNLPAGSSVNASSAGTPNFNMGTNSTFAGATQ